MNAKTTYKVPKGKLLKISLDFDNKKRRINDIKITGDFFAYPEESIETIEKKLKNIPLEKEKIEKQIDFTIKENNFKLIGVNAEQITKGIMKCFKK
ncbi:MAG: lipoate protein ligase C-terminal domain-containing protein [Candidatus Thermoplasmatota archaeon]